jgi:hypothetical protein
MDAAGLSLYRTSLTCRVSTVHSRRQRGDSGTDAAAVRSPRIRPLSFMLKELGADFFWNHGWIESVAIRLEKRSSALTLFGTAFAWVHFFDTVPERFALPEGSVVLETGGFKGRSREVSRDELYALFSERLECRPATVSPNTA